MRKFLTYIILFLIPFFIASVTLFLIPIDKKFSYNFVKGECENKASWIYNRVFVDNRDIDVVFVGASQTGCAIMDDVIEKELNKDLKRKINVVNFGYCRRGRDIQYVMLKDMFSIKKPKIIVLEVAEDEPKKSHPVFPYLANTKDLFDSFVLFNQRYLVNVFKGTTVRFEFLKYKVFNTDIEIPENPEPFGYRHSSQHVIPI